MVGNQQSYKKCFGVLNSTLVSIAGKSAKSSKFKIYNEGQLCQCVEEAHPGSGRTT